MLQGTLDVFSLDEVLGLLSGANKDGVLNITGDRGVGSVSIADGQLVAGSASSAPEAAELADVVFELLRYEEGSFSFDGGAVVEGEPHELEAIMTEAHSRLGEWKGIEAIVPSLDHHVSLSAELTTTQVTLSESEWATIVAVGEGASVGVVARRLSLGEFDGSKRIKSLIERSLASLDEGSPIAAPILDVPASAPIAEVEDTPAFTAPVFATPAPEHASFADVNAPVIDAPVETAAPEMTAADIATDFSFETVAPDAPAFEDFAADTFEVDAEIPPMPDAPAFASFEAEDALDVPPMPEPPSTFAAAATSDPIPSAPTPPFGGDVFDAPVPPAPDVAPSTFGGLEPIDGPELFEASLRGGDRSTDVFGSDGFDAGAAADAEMEAPVPPPPAPTDAVHAAAADDGLPSFAPPASFDANAFAAGDDLPMSDGEEAEATDDTEEKGGSLLMRYLKSNG